MMLAYTMSALLFAGMMRLRILFASEGVIFPSTKIILRFYLSLVRLMLMLKGKLCISTSLKVLYVQ